MKKKIAVLLTLILVVGLLSGCSYTQWREDRQIKSTASNFLKEKANLDYKKISGLEGSKYATAAAKKKLQEEAKQQVAVYKEAKGNSTIVGTPNFKITKKTDKTAEIETTFNLKVNSDVNKQSNGTKKFSFKATMKKEKNWLVDTWGFAPLEENTKENKTQPKK